MDELTPEIARIFEDKQKRRLRLAALPYAEKARTVAQLQRMVAPILLARGCPAPVWPLDSEPPEAAQ